MSRLAARAHPALLARLAGLIGSALLLALLAPAMPGVAEAGAQETCDPRQVYPPCETEPTPDSQAPSVTFTAPVGTTFGNPQQTVTVEFCDDSTLVSSSKRITVGGVDRTSAFNYVTGSRSGCGAFATSTGTVTLAKGGQSIVASISDAAGNARSKSKSVTLVDGYLVTSAGFNAGDNHRPDVCEASCFGAMYVASTVPYFSLGTPRNVSVVYRSDQHFARPFIYLDVTGFTDDAPSFTEYWFEVEVAGVKQYFTNTSTGNPGTDSKLVFSSPRAVVRLGGQIDASGLETGAHRMRIMLTPVSSGVAHAQQIVETRLVVVNEIDSPVGRGWSIAGLQRLHEEDSSAVLITDGSGGAAHFRSCGADCWLQPHGDVTRVQRTADGWVRAYPDSTRVSFDTLGRMSRVTDRLGSVVRYEYADSSYKLIGITDPYRTQDGSTAKAAITLSYGTYGLSEIRDPGPTGTGSGGRATTFVVDASRRVTSIQDPDGLSTHFGYDATGRLASVTDRRGGVTQFGYHASSWKLASLQLPQVEVVESGSSVLRTPTVTFRPWQSVGVPTSSTSTTSPATPLHPDSMTARVTDPIGRVSSFGVTKWGQPTKMVDPVGRVTTIAYGGIFVDKITTPDGAVTDYTFNSWGQLASFQAPGEERVYIRYGAAGQPDSIYHSGRMIQRRYLQAGTGRVDSVKVLGTDSVTNYSYTSHGRVLEEKDWRNHVTRYRYESRFGNVDSVGTENGSYTLTRYDDHGRVSGTATRNAAGLEPWTSVTYDALNRPIQAADGVNPSPTKYEYDALFLTKVRDPKGQVYRVALNALGWATHQYDPSDTTSWSKFVKTGYDAAGRAVAVTNRRGLTVNYTFDSLDRLTRKSGTNVATANYSYSPDGRISVSSNAISRDSVFRSATQWTDSVVTWIAGKRFRVLYKASKYKELDSIGVSTTTSIVFAGRRYYRPSGLLDSVRVGSQVIKFGYDDHLQRDTTTWPGGSQRIERYNTTHQLAYTSFTNGFHNNAFWRNYTYDKLGRIGQEDQKYGSGTEIHSFAYDSLGQLRRTTESTSSESTTCPEPTGTQVISDGSDCTSSLTREYTLDETYLYDAAGNLTSRQNTLNGTSTSPTYTTPNRLVSWGTTTYEHDLDGNRTRKLAGSVDTRYGWDSEGRLTSVTVGSRGVNYDYDALGRLVRRRINGIADRYFLWVGDHLLAELDATATTRIAEYAYLPGIDRPLALVTGGTTIAATRFYQQDAMGNVDGVFNTTGVVQNLDYDVRGRWFDNSALADTNRLRWKGLVYERDSTKLYYMRNRWYDPETGRFLTEDPLGISGGMNLYVFAGNDLINRWDPYGLISCPAGQRPARWVNVQTGEVVAEWCEEIQTSGGGSGPYAGVSGVPGTRGYGPGDFPTGDGPDDAPGGTGPRGPTAEAPERVPHAELQCAARNMRNAAITGAIVGGGIGFGKGLASAPRWGRIGAGVGGIVGGVATFEAGGVGAIPGARLGAWIGMGGAIAYHTAAGVYSNVKTSIKISSVGVAVGVLCSQ